MKNRKYLYNMCKETKINNVCRVVQNKQYMQNNLQL